MLEDLLAHVTATGGAVSVFILVVFLVMGTMLRRLEKGPAEIQQGYGSLTASLQANALAADTRAIAAELRADIADRKAQLEHSARVVVEEYARGLEAQLGVPHRAWSHQLDDPEPSRGEAR